MPKKKKILEKLILDANCQLNELKSGVDIVSSHVSLRIEEIRTFQGIKCLEMIQNSFESGYAVTESTKKFLQNDVVFMTSNWSKYVTSRVNKDYHFLKKCKDRVDDDAGEFKITRSLIENVHDAEQRLRFFFDGKTKNLSHRRLRWLLCNPEYGFSKKNEQYGSYNFWITACNDDGAPLLSYSQRLKWQQPLLDFRNDFYAVPFISEIIQDLSQYYPWDDADFDELTHEQLTLKYLMIRLAGLARFRQGFPGCSFVNENQAFSKQAINKMVLRRSGNDKVKIQGCATPETLVSLILAPKSIAGKLSECRNS